VTAINANSLEKHHIQRGAGQDAAPITVPKIAVMMMTGRRMGMPPLSGPGR
jgi:hypothetical protein